MGTLPATFPPAAAEFHKPYMEFEYEGKVYRVENVDGGHNGRVAEGCKANPPEWDETKQRWVVPVENHVIDIDFSQHPHFAAALAGLPAFMKLRITSNPRSSRKSVGQLITAGNRAEAPRYPIDCVFNMYVRAVLPGKWPVINVRPFRLVARGLTQWPPPVGTTYINEDPVELFPEWIPFAEKLLKPIVTIRPGDHTILTRVFENVAPAERSTGVRAQLRAWINRLS